jgi:hypothetical protein
MTKKIFKTIRKKYVPIKLIGRKKKEKKEIKLGTWSAAEDKILDEWVKNHGPQKWAKCAELIKERSGKQCRDHWLNKLKSNLKKGHWTSEEDLLIIRFYAKYKSWNKIIPIFEGRAENSIKNRFFSRLRALRKRKSGDNGEDHNNKLDRLVQYIDEASKKAEERYFNENKNMTKEDLETYINKIEQELNNKEPKIKNMIKYINLKRLRKSINPKLKKNIDAERFKSEIKDKEEDTKNYKDMKAMKENNFSGLKNIFENMDFFNKKIRNNTLSKDYLLDDYKSDDISSIFSNDDNDLVITEEINGNILNNNGLGTYIQTTKNIAQVKKRRFINLINLNY